MPLTSIANRLRLTVGLATESLGASALESAVRTRMRAVAAESVEAYAAQVGWDGLELHQLVEELVVPETWFFRESGAFRELAARALGAHEAKPARTFRVLSAPCSTGEEPYSIAITLLDVGLSPASFKIDAVDISKAALAGAERGRYRPHSFRGVEPDFRMRYFDPRDGEFQIAPEVRECVRFFQANLVDSMFLANEIPYQAIFCRNVLIYMHDEARAAALNSLNRLLDPNGVLFAGHAEALDSMSRHFRRLGAGFAFAKRSASIKPEARSDGKKRAAAARREAAPTIAAQARQAVPQGVRETAKPQTDTLAVAAELADRGELERAAVLCEKYLQERGPDVRAYALLGVVQKARGQVAQAESSFSRVLYLEPGHADALLHMALLAESRGDAVAAKNFRRRAERAGRGRP
jgi:chemotaxis protein methyltransferase WspC